MEVSFIKKILADASSHKNFCFATITESTEFGTPRKTGAKMIVYEDKTIFGTIGGGKYEKQVISDCLKAIKTGLPQTKEYECLGRKNQPVCGGKFKVFIEPFRNINKLIILGGGHIGLALSIIGKFLNFDVTVIDNRTAFANKKRFPHVDKIICGNYTNILSKLKFDEKSFVVILTHEHKHDFECLKALINDESINYIGVISSHAKKIQFHNELSKLGITKNKIKKICMPVGLDIGAQTPEEIAISIISEIITIQNKNFLKSKKFKNKKEIVHHDSNKR